MICLPRWNNCPTAAAASRPVITEVINTIDRPLAASGALGWSQSVEFVPGRWNGDGDRTGCSAWHVRPAHWIAKVAVLLKNKPTRRPGEHQLAARSVARECRSLKSRVHHLRDFRRREHPIIELNVIQVTVEPPPEGGGRFAQCDCLGRIPGPRSGVGFRPAQLAVHIDPRTAVDPLIVNVSDVMPLIVVHRVRRGKGIDVEPGLARLHKQGAVVLHYDHIAPVRAAVKQNGAEGTGPAGAW